MDRKVKPKTQDEFGLNVGDYVIVTLIEPLSIGPSDSEYIIGAKIDSGSIEIVNLDVNNYYLFLRNRLILNVNKLIYLFHNKPFTTFNSLRNIIS